MALPEGDDYDKNILCYDFDKYLLHVVYIHKNSKYNISYFACVKVDILRNIYILIQYNVTHNVILVEFHLKFLIMKRLY